MFSSPLPRGVDDILLGPANKESGWEIEGDAVVVLVEVDESCGGWGSRQGKRRETRLDNV